MRPLKRASGSDGIGSLKVRYNSVFGYYIEITKATWRWLRRTTSVSRRW